MGRRVIIKVLIGIAMFAGLSQGSYAHADSIQRYLINSPGMYLGKLSYLLYGTSKRWAEIARFNHLKNPNLIRLGQWIELPEKANLSAELWAERMQRFAAFQAARKGGKGAPFFAQVAKVERVPRSSAPIAVATPKTIDTQSAIPNSKKDQWIQAGGLAFEAKNYGQAVQYYRKAKKSEKESLEAWFGELRALEAAGRKQELLTTAQALLQRWPKLKNLSYLARVLNPKQQPGRGMASEQTRP